MRKGPRSADVKWNISVAIYDTDIPLIVATQKELQYHNMSVLFLKIIYNIYYHAST
jgi:hypothetical protein